MHVNVLDFMLHLVESWGPTVRFSRTNAEGRLGRNAEATQVYSQTVLCQGQSFFCRRNVRSSSFRKIGSSVFIEHGGSKELWMTAKERDPLKVLHEVKKRHITQKQAAAKLGLSVRWVRTLLVRLQARGDSALRHGLRERPSNGKPRKQ